jgi:hypothetical protein
MNLQELYHLVGMIESFEWESFEANQGLQHNHCSFSTMYLHQPHCWKHLEEDYYLEEDYCLAMLNALIAWQQKH